LEEFSSVNESDSKEGENNCEHNSGDNNTQGEIIGTIPPSHIDDRSRTMYVANENERNDVKDNEVEAGNERSNAEDNEVVVVGTIPCPTNPGDETSDKQPIVYQKTV
jgi:hypothetical protein